MAALVVVPVKVILFLTWAALERRVKVLQAEVTQLRETTLLVAVAVREKLVKTPPLTLLRERVAMVFKQT
jgi:hypothetical protein